MINGKGEFLAGIADMDILSHIPEAHLNNHSFQASKILVIDSNISEESLSYILNNSQNVEHVIYEPISKEKSSRILNADLLSKITILKPNIIQLRDIYHHIQKAKENELEMFDVMNIQLSEDEQVVSAATKMSQAII